MRTTLDLNEKLIRELMDVTSAKTKTDAIHQAASELIRRKNSISLSLLSGKIRLDFDLIVFSTLTPVLNALEESFGPLPQQLFADSPAALLLRPRRS